MSSKKQQRPCPAKGELISPRECGEKRGSVYACPADCPFFPFTPANYDEHSEIEQRLIQLSFERSARLMSPQERAEMVRLLDASEGDPDEPVANHARIAWLFHKKRDADGRTFSERWLADKFSGLSNDERVLLTAMSRMRPGLLEVHRVLDEQTIEGVDLLDGTPLRAIDRGVAGSVVRYSVLVVWCYSMAHYDRLSGDAMACPDTGSIEPREALREVIRHLGGPAGIEAERLWLAENFGQVIAALTAVRLARTQLMMKEMDARYTKTDYAVLKALQLKAALSKWEGLEPEELSEEELAQGFDASFVCHRGQAAPDSGQLQLPLTAPPVIPMGMQVIGRILVGKKRVRIEAMTAERSGELRRIFEGRAKDAVNFLGERVDDMGLQLAGKRAEPYDAGLIPPRLLQDPPRITIQSQVIAVDEVPDGDLHTVTERMYARFPDEPIPWLDNRTPRSAAADPELRPRLLNLMKVHIRGLDRRRRREGLTFDLNPLLAELGLHELISEPPAFWDEELLLDEAFDEDFDEDFDDGVGFDEDAPLPPGALNYEEIDARLERMNAVLRAGNPLAFWMNDFPACLISFTKRAGSISNRTSCCSCMRYLPERVSSFPRLIRGRKGSIWSESARQ